MVNRTANFYRKSYNVSSRKSHFNEAGHAHELTFSTYHRLPLLEAEMICKLLGEALLKACHTHEVSLWAYVFMPDHVHLMVYPRAVPYSIETFCKDFKSRVGRKAIKFICENHPEVIPRLTRYRGMERERAFWQSGGGYDRNVIEDTTLRKMIDYIHLNPVRRGLVDRIIDWKWSSASWYLNHAEGPLPIDEIPAEVMR